jgi:hypothetical protein
MFPIQVFLFTAKVSLFRSAHILHSSQAHQRQTNTAVSTLFDFLVTWALWSVPCCIWSAGWWEGQVISNQSVFPLEPVIQDSPNKHHNGSDLRL